MLSVLAENGWVVTDDDKLVGTAHHVQSVINGCIIGLRLVRARPVTYRATAVNGHSPDYFGDKAEQLLGVPNPIQSDFANALAQLQADGVIPDC